MIISCADIKPVDQLCLQWQFCLSCTFSLTLSFVLVYLITMVRVGGFQFLEICSYVWKVGSGDINGEYTACTLVMVLAARSRVDMTKSFFATVKCGDNKTYHFVSLICCAQMGNGEETLSVENTYLNIWWKSKYLPYNGNICSISLSPFQLNLSLLPLAWENMRQPFQKSLFLIYNAGHPRIRTQ